ncbi:MAG: hypothetical protein QNK29_10485 [Desulfobacterales bacterium]|nr:hypothetical protein [Desulfobacterales bacterium]MDX2512362.1 hypothetical protein [Desulfobacterales bacterium]
MTGLYANQQWVFIAIIFFGIIAYIAFIRQRDRKWIEKKFRGQKILAMSFGVNYFGRASEPGKPRSSSGFLLLLPDQVFYRSRSARLELSIPGANIAHVYPDNSLKGVDLHQSVVKIDFINERGNKDAAAFKVPYPPQWIQVIKNNLLHKVESITEKTDSL